MDTLKRWAKGLLTVIAAWLGGFNEMPQPQPDEEDGDGQPGT